MWHWCKALTKVAEVAEVLKVSEVSEVSGLSEVYGKVPDILR